MDRPDEGTDEIKELESRLIDAMRDHYGPAAYASLSRWALENGGTGIVIVGWGEFAEMLASFFPEGSQRREAPQ